MDKNIMYNFTREDYPSRKDGAAKKVEISE